MSDLIFLTGSGRSGTTAVLRAITRLPGFAGIDRLAAGFPSLLGVQASVRRRNVWLPSRIGAASSECLGMFRRAGLTPDTLSPTTVPMEFDVDDLSFERFGRLTRAWQARRGDVTTVIKSTAAATRIPGLSEALPNAGFIYVHRNPIAVASSLARVAFFPTMRLWWDPERRTPVGMGADDPSRLAVVGLAHVHQQSEAATAGLHRVANGRVFKLSYEHPELEPLSHFLDVDLASIESAFDGFEQSRANHLRPDWEFGETLFGAGLIDRLRGWSQV